MGPKEKEIAAIQERMAQPGFWDGQEQSNRQMRELKSLKNVVEPFVDCVKRLADAREFLPLADGDEAMTRHIIADIAALKIQIDALELQAILSGPYDANNALLSINAGAGGTESCDWANMLLRMYTRWCDIRGFKCEIIDILHGEEAGIKNATLRIEGD
ncbi:MAG TPA: PCRF domain-containing protein, partial [Candidatus Omnitrophota bacterium]|nr:PCRF domain-containing protein [Candidatus Omnitrophota bacterium]